MKSRKLAKRRARKPNPDTTTLAVLGGGVAFIGLGLFLLLKK